MSTHAYLAVALSDNPKRFRTVYVHSDGYLSYTGRMLLDHYNSEELAQALVAEGNISKLDEQSGPLPSMSEAERAAMVERLKTHRFGYGTEMPGLCVFYQRDRGDLNATGQLLYAVDLIRMYPHEYVYVWDGKHWSARLNSLMQPLDQALAQMTEDD